MAKRVGVDKWLFGTVLLLVLFGLVSVFSASAVMAKATQGSPYAFVYRQAIWAALGIVALFGLMRVDYRKYNNPRLIFPLMAVTALMLLGVFAWGSMNGAHRWLHFGPASLQPSELAKPVIVFFLAWFLQTRIHAIDNVKETLLPAVIPPLVYVLLILQGAGSGHSSGLRGGRDGDAVSRGHADEVDRFGDSGCGSSGDLLHALPCGLPRGAHEGVPES